MAERISTDIDIVSKGECTILCTDSDGISAVCSVRFPGYLERTSASIFDFPGL